MGFSLYRFINLKTIIGIVLAAFTMACSSMGKKKDFSQGFIEYSIEYQDDQAPAYNASMRPNKMVIKFKDNNTINKIEGLSGAFSFAFIQNMETQTTYTLIKLLNKKLYHKETIQTEKYPFAYNDMPPFNICKTDETESFLGMTCHKALATYQDSTIAPFEIWYTNDIEVINPNWNTPFQEIEGIMLKFSAIIFNQKMNIIASSIKSAKVSDDEFIIPSDYEEINQETVKDVVDLLK